jgi:acyl-[acyl-carrier-protein]-phospholipid O-acyltransferase/long-chain-fatty-acid--[acyl-carrier-protein] ligase
VIVGTKAVTANEQGYVVAIGMMALALACWVSARMIPATAEAAPDLRINPNVIASTMGLLESLWQDGRLWRGSVATGWFWLVGAVILQLIPTLVKDRLGGSDNLYIACITLFSLGIAGGSLLAAWMAHGRIILLPTRWPAS